MHKHRIGDLEESESFKSDSFLHISREDTIDVAHAIHKKPSENMEMIISAIDDFFCIRF